MVQHWKLVIQGSEPQRMEAIKDCAERMASSLDYIPFPQEQWKDVKRYKWNTHGTLPFFGKQAIGQEVQPRKSKIDGDREEHFNFNDPDFWGNDWDVSALKRYFNVLFPGFRGVLETEKEAAAEIERLFGGLACSMGGHGVVRKFTWPCSLVLATRC